MTGRVKNGNHENRFPDFIDAIDHAVREALGIPPAHVHHRVTPRTGHGVLRNVIPKSDDFIHKLVPKSCFPSLIPVGRLSDVLPNLRPEFHTPFHPAELERSDAFMSASEIAEDGSRR